MFSVWSHINSVIESIKSFFSFNSKEEEVSKEIISEDATINDESVSYNELNAHEFEVSEEHEEFPEEGGLVLDTEDIGDVTDVEYGFSESNSVIFEEPSLMENSIGETEQVVYDSSTTDVQELFNDSPNYQQSSDFPLSF